MAARLLHAAMIIMRDITSYMSILPIKKRLHPVDIHAASIASPISTENLHYEKELKINICHGSGRKPPAVSCRSKTPIRTQPREYHPIMVSGGVA
ncbi:uncharacterized protein TrAtP1_006961 [Trichoderma atroviride]|uniref:uncharacterized protein n=1 Tax=Hypocrea atroviridis TaxID=63577 RepID=UPI00333333A3|nr:hypothetical protein TrAtP1_006961 [Trichoderma atroviride]